METAGLPVCDWTASRSTEGFCNFGFLSYLVPAVGSAWGTVYLVLFCTAFASERPREFAATVCVTATGV